MPVFEKLTLNIPMEQGSIKRLRDKCLETKRCTLKNFIDAIKNKLLLLGVKKLDFLNKFSELFFNAYDSFALSFIVNRHRDNNFIFETVIEEK